MGSSAMAGSIRDDFQRKFHQFHTHATNILRPKQLSDFFRRNPWALYQLSMRHTPKFCRVLEGQNQSKSCQVSILEGTSRNIMVIPSLYQVLQAKKVMQFPAAIFFASFYPTIPAIPMPGDRWDDPNVRFGWWWPGEINGNTCHLHGETVKGAW